MQAAHQCGRWFSGTPGCGVHLGSMPECEEMMRGVAARLRARQEQSIVREWLRQELGERYDDTLAAPLPEELLRLLPCT